MKIKADERLFWFLKEGTVLDLDKPAALDLYLEQVMTRGGTRDVKQMLRTVQPVRLKERFPHLKPFLPSDVRNFWLDFLGSY